MSKLYIISMQNGCYDSYVSTVISILSEKQKDNIQKSIEIINCIFDYNDDEALELWDKYNPKPILKSGQKTKKDYQDHQRMCELYLIERNNFKKEEYKNFINSFNSSPEMERFFEYMKNHELEYPHIDIEEMEVFFTVQENDSGNDCLNKIIDFITKH